MVPTAASASLAGRTAAIAAISSFTSAASSAKLYSKPSMCIQAHWGGTLYLVLLTTMHAKIQENRMEGIQIRTLKTVELNLSDPAVMLRTVISWRESSNNEADWSMHWRVNDGDSVTEMPLFANCFNTGICFSGAHSTELSSQYTALDHFSCLFLCTSCIVFYCCS